MRVSLDLNSPSIKHTQFLSIQPKPAFLGSYAVSRAFAPANLALISFTGNVQARQEISELQKARYDYQPKLPKILRGNSINNLQAAEGRPTTAAANSEEIEALFPFTYGKPIITLKPDTGIQTSKISARSILNTDFNKPSKPLKVGVILSGGQAPGGHNVITGLYDSLQKINSESKLYGFLGGPSGIVDNKYIEFDENKINSIRNTGGFDVIGSGRTKLETEEQFEKVLKNAKTLGLNAITIVGGDDSNTNAAVLAEWLAARGEKIGVIGCPKTIDGDLKNDQIEASFGFDTATKTYAEIVGNIEKDAASAKKYWHFVKIMGRSASHVALEVALQTHPNITLISEEIAQKQMSLNGIVTSMAVAIVNRAANGKNYGVAVIPEGVIEFIPEMNSLIGNLNELVVGLEEDKDYANAPASEKFAIVESKLEKDNAKVFNTLPDSIKGQLLMDRDAHGNVQVSKIDTEKLLIEMVSEKLKEMKKHGLYNDKFSTQSHFVGYEGRCAFPSNFDADYCYSLGATAAALIKEGKTGYMASVKNLNQSADNWEAGGIPITMMFNMERRNGKDKPVIKKALVELEGPVFEELKLNRKSWEQNDHYLIPGAIQYFGPAEVADKVSKTLALEKEG